MLNKNSCWRVIRQRGDFLSALFDFTSLRRGRSVAAPGVGAYTDLAAITAVVGGSVIVLDQDPNFVQVLESDLGKAESDHSVTPNSARSAKYRPTMVYSASSPRPRTKAPPPKHLRPALRRPLCCASG